MTTTLAAPVPVPDLSFLAGLEPGVAYAALATIVIVMGLIYLGPGIRDRLRAQPPAPPDPPQVAAAQPPAVTAAVTQEQEVTSRFIDNLEAQVADLKRELRQERAERERDRVEIDRLQSEIDRSTWRRGEQ